MPTSTIHFVKPSHCRGTTSKYHKILVPRSKIHPTHPSLSVVMKLWILIRPLPVKWKGSELQILCATPSQTSRSLRKRNLTLLTTRYQYQPTWKEILNAANKPTNVVESPQQPVSPAAQTKSFVKSTVDIAQHTVLQRKVGSGQPSVIDDVMAQRCWHYNWVNLLAVPLQLAWNWLPSW